MAQFPSLPLWTDAYLADTRHLSTLEHGAYLLLLMEAWRRPTCSLPDDDNLLSRLTGLTLEQWTEIKPTVMAFWSYDGRSRVWTQKRLQRELVYVHDVRAKRKDAAAKRWNKTKNDDANAMQSICKTDAPTPTPTPIKKDNPPTPRKSAKPRDEDLVDVLSKVLSHEVAEDFVAHRKAIRKPMTLVAAQQIAKKLGGLSPQHADATAMRSIEAGWSGVFPESGKSAIGSAHHSPVQGILARRRTAQ